MIKDFRALMGALSIIAFVAAQSVGSMSAFGGTDVNLITGSEIHPRITQDEGSVWGNGNTVVVVYNDSRGSALTPINVCGASVSTDGGITFARLSTPFTGLGACLGNPSIFYSVADSTWYATFLTGQGSCTGVGQWESTNGTNWTASGCISSGNALDRPTTWVDNNLGSPFYGRQYAIFNDFNTSGGAVRSTFSTDNGLSWSAPISVTAAFRRAVKITGSLGADGTIFAQTLEEGGGGLNGPRQNFIYRSTDGGATWSAEIAQGATFLGPGRGTNGTYLVGMYNTPVSGYWREMGWGQPGVGPSGVVHYAYSASFDFASDPGNIQYIRSLDNGLTWSAPVRLNNDFTSRAQWSPSLSVSSTGRVFVSWYDERNTTSDSLQVYGRSSFDNGATWSIDEPVSDVIFPKPLQPDTNIAATYVGQYNHAMFSSNGYGSVAYHTWTDGRVSILGPQQDVFFDKITFPATAAAVSVSGRVVTPEGRGLRNAVVQMTDASGNSRQARTSSFGYFVFEEVEVGQTYVFRVSSKRYRFEPKVVSISDETAELIFIAEN